MGAERLPWNVPELRGEPGRWREVLKLLFIYEDLRQSKNRVEFDPEDPGRPVMHFKERSQYARDGLDALPADLEEFVEPLPVEDVRIAPEPTPTESHIVGTTVMGSEPDNSVLDADLRHHRLRNLVVLGSGAFPTAAPANPTLTICALSLRSAERLV